MLTYSSRMFSASQLFSWVLIVICQIEDVVPSGSLGGGGGSWSPGTPKFEHQISKGTCYTSGLRKEDSIAFIVQR